MISYEPLFKTMKEKNVTTYKLQKMGFSRATYYAMKNGEGVSVHTINKLCTILQCDVPAIMEYIAEN